MGLFVSDDGHLQGWLAAFLCCCAAVSEDEYPIEKQKISRPTTSRNTVWHEQPTPLRPMPSTPTRTLLPPAAVTTSTNKGIEAAFNDEDLVRPISERPPSLKPLDFGGESPLLGRMSLHSRQKSSTTLPKRISISRPTDFRRLEYTEKQRRSLVPLQLSPVVLREHTPEPPVGDLAANRLSRYADGLTDEPNNRNSYRASRGTPFERCQQLSTSARSGEPAAGVNERGQIMMDNKIQQTPTRPALSTQSSTSSMYSLRRQALESSTSTTSISSRPSSSERIKLKRKRSSQKNSGDSADLNIDKEILELNTIVEERRAESTRPQSPTEDHVAAVAPAMPLRARSETLTDIGSAFSRPLISLTTSIPQPEPSTQPIETTMSPVTPIKSRLSRPFMAMPDPSVDQSTQQPIRRPSSRITGWLSNLLSSSSTSTPSSNNNAPQDQQFYTCAPPVRHRAISQISLCTSNTDIDSTTASSPISKGHSRSLTAESRMTPISPPSTVDENVELELRPKSGDPWPTVVEHPSQVGLAL